MLATQDHSRRARPSPAATAAIALSLAAHAGLFGYLYYQRIELPASPPERPPMPLDGVFLRPPPPPPPVERPADPKPPPPVQTAPRAQVRESIPPTTPTELSPLVPYSGPVSDGPPVLVDVPVGPLTGPVVDVGPVVSPPSPPASAGVITRPNWLSRPSGEQMARYYPRRALEREISGRAVLQCRVTAAGQVAACTVAGETPAGAGFGEAALKLARYFRMSPQTEDGQPVEGGSVRVPLVFNLAD